MTKRLLNLALIVFILTDIGYSFIQFFHTHLDGDMAAFIIQTDEWKKVLNDPFGFNVLFHNEYYSDPNRFFSHWFISYYFKNVPFLLQHLTNPINSIYLSCAIIKIIVQVLIICLMSSVICQKNKNGSQFIISAAIIIPLFQTFGYSGYMGIIDQSISYFFFYALPFSILFLFYFILFITSFNVKLVHYFKKIILISLAFILPFSGPLIPGIVLILNFILFYKFILMQINYDSQNISLKKLINIINKIPARYLFILLLISLLSLISLYIGTHNSINLNSISVKERYLRLPEGLYNMLTQKLGLSLLLIVIGINTFIIKYKKFNDKWNWIYQLIKLIFIFSILYILLLPLGGYRFYRPNILRFDTFMPITFLLILYYGISTYYLINNIGKKNKIIYLSFIILVSVIYTLADKPTYNDFYCERKSLEEISRSNEKICKLDSDCNVMSWEKIRDYNKSEYNAQLLYFWGVTKEKKLYFQE